LYDKRSLIYYDWGNYMVRKRKGGNFDWFAVAIIVISLYFSYNFIQQQSRLNAIERNCGEVQLRLDAARQKNQSLRAEKERLESHAYIEKVAREDLGMTRRGEMPYISVKH